MQFEDIKITLSKRKTIALHIHEDGNVELRAPYGVRRQILVDMVSKKSNWIKQKKAQCDERLSQLNLKKVQWQHGIEIPYYQGSLTLCYQLGRKYHVEQVSDQLMITSPSASADVLRKHYFQWLRTKARLVFAEKAKCWSQQLFPGNQQPIQIQPRLMSSRWGSCSKNKSLRLNLILMMLPESLMDYVIVHELCHWQVFNHSRQFYQLLETVLPNWKILEKQLRDHQYLLLEAKS